MAKKHTPKLYIRYYNPSKDETVTYEQLNDLDTILYNTHKMYEERCDYTLKFSHIKITKNGDFIMHYYAPVGSIHWHETKE